MMFDRRRFLGTTAAAVGIAALPKAAFAAEKADVVIVGAGLSGLNAALILKEQGLNVLVLDANSIVGGRVRTHQTAEGPIDVGASQIGRSYARVIDMCQKLDLKLIPEDRDLLSFGANYRGTWIDNAKWADNPLNQTVGDERKIPPMLLAQRLTSKYNPFTEVTDWLDPKFAQQDISLRQLLTQKGHSKQAIELASLWPSGIGIDETSVLRMWQEETRGAFDLRFGETGEAVVQHDREHPFGETHQRKLVNGLTSTSNIDGGCHLLPYGMAAKLGDAIRLNKKVGRIELTDTGGTVHCQDGSSYQGRFVISTLPFSVLREVKIEGGNGGASADAIAHMPYANTARLYLTVLEPFWEQDGLPPSFQTDGPIGMFWGIKNNQGGPSNRAMIVLTGPSAMAITGKGEGAADFLISELHRLRPASVGKVRKKTFKDWGFDPLQRGCGFSLAPGQVNRFARTMLEPWKTMHFAGEHTRRLDFGMESAMESGERAAMEILGRA